MYVRFWPLLVMERVPLVSVGALPHPAVEAAAAEAVPPRTPVSIAAPSARARAAATVPPAKLRLDITRLPLLRRRPDGGARCGIGWAAVVRRPVRIEYGRWSPVGVHGDHNGSRGSASIHARQCWQKVSWSYKNRPIGRRTHNGFSSPN